MDASVSPAFSALVPALILAMNIGIGLVAGYCVGRRRAGDPVMRPETPDPSGETQASIDRLEALTTQVNDRVAQHNQRVEAISLTLAGSETDAKGEGHVVAAAAKGLLDANSRLQSELVAARQALAEQAERLSTHRHEARTDTLTGLANRRALNEELLSRMAMLSVQPRQGTLLLADIDHFKQFNDRYGHQTGDLVLRQVASALRDAASESGGMAARFGGEEFALLLPAMEPARADEHAQHARLAVANQVFRENGQELKVTISLGMTQIQPHDTSETLIERADSALYAAKRAGRNRVFLHDGTEMLALAETASAKKTASETRPRATVALAIAPEPAPEPAWHPGAHERRKHPRLQFSGTQWIAPYVDGIWPDDNAFHEVQGLDVSTGGFAYTTRSKPTVQKLLVRFSVGSDVRYLSTRICYSALMTDGSGRFRVGCQFLGRLEPGGAPSDDSSPAYDFVQSGEAATSCAAVA